MTLQYTDEEIDEILEEAQADLGWGFTIKEYKQWRCQNRSTPSVATIYRKCDAWNHANGTIEHQVAERDHELMRMWLEGGCKSYTSHGGSLSAYENDDMWVRSRE